MPASSPPSVPPAMRIVLGFDLEAQQELGPGRQEKSRNGLDTETVRQGNELERGKVRLGNSEQLGGKILELEVAVDRLDLAPGGHQGGQGDRQGQCGSPGQDDLGQQKNGGCQESAARSSRGWSASRKRQVCTYLSMRSRGQLRMRPTRAGLWSELPRYGSWSGRNRAKLEPPRGQSGPASRARLPLHLH